MYGFTYPKTWPKGPYLASFWVNLVLQASVTFFFSFLGSSLEGDKVLQNMGTFICSSVCSFVSLSPFKPLRSEICPVRHIGTQASIWPFQTPNMASQASNPPSQISNLASNQLPGLISALSVWPFGLQTKTSPLRADFSPLRLRISPISFPRP